LLHLDGQVHHDTHAIPKGNYVIGVGKSMIVSPSEAGNYKIADTGNGLRPNLAAEQSVDMLTMDRLLYYR
jgi:hypothetical protein